MTRPHAVVFDLDDTLFDHTGSAADAVAGWVTKLGATPSDELLERWFAIETTHFDAWLAGRVSHQEQRRLRLRDFLPLLDLPVPDGDALTPRWTRRTRSSWTGTSAAGGPSPMPGRHWRLPAATICGSAC